MLRASDGRDLLKHSSANLRCSTLLFPHFLSSHYLICFRLCFDYILPHCRNPLLYRKVLELHHPLFLRSVVHDHHPPVRYLESNYRTMQLLIKRLCVQESDATKQVSTSVIASICVCAPTTFCMKLRQNPPNLTELMEA